jgi:hypothetical protein
VWKNKFFCAFIHVYLHSLLKNANLLIWLKKYLLILLPLVKNVGYTPSVAPSPAIQHVNSEDWSKLQAHQREWRDKRGKCILITRWKAAKLFFIFRQSGVFFLPLAKVPCAEKIASPAQEHLIKKFVQTLMMFSDKVFGGVPLPRFSQAVALHTPAAAAASSTSLFF